MRSDNFLTVQVIVGSRLGNILHENVFDDISLLFVSCSTNISEVNTSLAALCGIYAVAPLMPVRSKVRFQTKRDTEVLRPGRLRFVSETCLLVRRECATT